ncbi:MAG: hypothetical protein LQ345_006884, partial [Seirophora villosa]
MSPTVLLNARPRTASAHPDGAGSQILLLEATIHHLRQAIRAQADIEAPLLRTQGTAVPVYEPADIITLKQAVDDIKASLDNVLDLEFNAASTSPLQPLSQNPATRNDAHLNHLNGDQLQYVLDSDNSLGTIEISLDSRDRTNDDDHTHDDDHIHQNDHTHGDDHINDEGHTNADNDQSVDDSEVKDETTSDDIPQGPREPQTPTRLTPPPSSQKPPGTSPSRTANVLSRLTPSRILNLFMPTPSPTPAKTKRSSTSPPPPVSDLADQDAIEMPGPSRRPSSSGPVVDDPTSLFLPQDSSSSEDELHTPLPQAISPVPTRQSRPRPLLPTRRSTRTVKPRTSTRLAQMIPPNFRAAGSMGAYKTLPGPTMRGDGDGRGRSVMRFSSVTVGHKRSGSASS